MDSLTTQETALDEIINFTVGNQSEFTNEGVRTLIKSVVNTYLTEHPKEEPSLTPDEELLKQFGIEILSTKFTRVQIDEKQLEFLLTYLPKLPEGQYARLKNPKGIYKLKEELLNHLGTESYKITVSNNLAGNDKIRVLSIYKNKKNIA